MGQRRTGSAYRRKMKIKHDDARKWVFYNGRPKPSLGILAWDRETGDWKSYMHYPKNSKDQKRMKRQSNKILRRRNEVCRGGEYRRYYDYWWNWY